MTAASNIQVTPCSRGHQETTSETHVIWNQPTHACSRNWTTADLVMNSRKSQDLQPATTRKCYCKIPSLETWNEETGERNYSTETEKNPSSIDCPFVGWGLICGFRRVSVCCLKAQRNWRLHCYIFSFKITSRSCDWMCSAVIYMVIDAAVSLRWGTTFFFLRGKMCKHIFSSSHMRESSKGRIKLFFPWVKVRVIWEIKWL